MTNFVKTLKVMNYPIGIQTFEVIRKRNFAYVDKTRLIYDLVWNNGYFFLSRPRRFGKSLLVSTLKAYFKGQADLFKGLEIDKYEKDWVKYPVFHIDFAGYNYNEKGTLEEALSVFLTDAESIYGKTLDSDFYGTRFRRVIQRAYQATGLPVVILTTNQFLMPLGMRALLKGTEAF